MGLFSSKCSRCGKKALGMFGCTSASVLKQQYGGLCGFQPNDQFCDKCFEELKKMLQNGGPRW